MTEYWYCRVNVQTRESLYTFGNNIYTGIDTSVEVSILLWKYKHDLSFCLSSFRFSIISSKSRYSFVSVSIPNQKYQTSINTFIRYHQTEIDSKLLSIIKRRLIRSETDPIGDWLIETLFDLISIYWSKSIILIVSVFIQSLIITYVMNESACRNRSSDWNSIFD